MMFTFGYRVHTFSLFEERKQVDVNVSGLGLTDASINETIEQIIRFSQTAEASEVDTLGIAFQFSPGMSSRIDAWVTPFINMLRSIAPMLRRITKCRIRLIESMPTERQGLGAVLDTITRALVALCQTASNVSELTWIDEMGVSARCLVPVSRVSHIQRMRFVMYGAISSERLKTMMESIYLQKNHLTNLEISNDLTLILDTEEDVKSWILDDQVDDVLYQNIAIDEQQQQQQQQQPPQVTTTQHSSLARRRVAYALASCKIHTLRLPGSLALKLLPSYLWQHMHQLSRLEIYNDGVVPPGSHELPGPVILSLYGSYLDEKSVESLRPWVTNRGFRGLELRQCTVTDAFIQLLPTFLHLVHLLIDSYMPPQMWLDEKTSKERFPQIYFPSLQSMHLRRRALYPYLTNNKRLMQQIRSLTIDGMTWPGLTALIRAGTSLNEIDAYDTFFDQHASAKAVDVYQMYLDNSQILNEQWTMLLRAINDNQTLMSVNLFRMVDRPGLRKDGAFWTSMLTRTTLLKFNTDYDESRLADFRNAYAAERQAVNEYLLRNRLTYGMGELFRTYVECLIANKGSPIQDSCIVTTLMNPFLDIVAKNTRYDPITKEYKWTNYARFRIAYRWLSEQVYSDGLKTRLKKKREYEEMVMKNNLLDESKKKSELASVANDIAMLENRIQCLKQWQMDTFGRHLYAAPSIDDVLSALRATGTTDVTAFASSSFTVASSAASSEASSEASASGARQELIMGMEDEKQQPITRPKRRFESISTERKAAASGSSQTLMDIEPPVIAYAAPIVSSATPTRVIQQQQQQQPQNMNARHANSSSSTSTTAMRLWYRM